MGVAEIEYTWVYPANWHFSGEPWRIRWLQIPYLQAKPRRELHFFLCLRTVRAASFQRWGTHAATETGIKSQNASLECSIWNSKRCYMGVQTPKMSISHIHTYIYIHTSKLLLIDLRVLFEHHHKTRCATCSPSKGCLKRASSASSYKQPRNTHCFLPMPLQFLWNKCPDKIKRNSANMMNNPHKKYTGKRPPTVWGVGRQCTRYKQQ